MINANSPESANIIYKKSPSFYARAFDATFQIN